MIEEIANDVLRKLLSTSSKDFENFVGIEDHMAKMSKLLQLESEEVRMVGIWGSSGIGKTTIARALSNQLSRNFQVSIFIDRAFVSKSKEPYRSANPDDHNMKLHLQKKFLSEILGTKAIKVNHLSAVEQRLKRQKVLIIIDDLDDQVILDSLVGQTQWFGSGSRVIVVTNDKHLLRAHSIAHIYEVRLPTEERALEMLCQSAFKQNSPRKGFEKLAVEVVRHVGSLPLALNVLGSSLRERHTDYWTNILPRLENGLDDKVDKVLRVSYDGLGNEEDKAIFRHIACIFNHVAVTTMELLFPDTNALQNLSDKSLIQIRGGHVEMHNLLEKMGRKIVRAQSIDEPGKREFLVDQEDICDVLSEGIGTPKILGISLDTSCMIHDLDIHKSSFEGMHNLHFLEIYSKIYTLEKEVRVHLPESFDYWPPKLKLFSWERYPMSCMPSGFRLEKLVKLEMKESKLEKLWEGVVSIPCLKEMNMWGSHNLKEIPDLSRAINLERLYLGYCSSLVELPSSIRNLNKLFKLDMVFCRNLENLPTGFNLNSLDYLRFIGCRKLRAFPKFSTNISCLLLEKTNIEEFPSNLCLENINILNISKNESDGKQWEEMKPLTPFLAMLCPTLWHLEVENIPNLVELPSSFQNLNQLQRLTIINCKNLETLPTGINLKSLRLLNLNGCSRLRSFPEISTNISELILEETGIEEVPWRIENFSKLTDLSMRNCRRLKCVSLNISKLKYLAEVNFSDCGALTRVDLSGKSSEVAMEADNIDTVTEEASSSLFDDYVPKANLDFSGCFKLDKEALLEQQQSISFKSMILAGVEVPSYFTHRTTGTSLTNIPLPHTSLSQLFFRFKAYVQFDCNSSGLFSRFDIHVCCRFSDRFGNHCDSPYRPYRHNELWDQYDSPYPPYMHSEFGDHFDSPYRPYMHIESKNGIHYCILECLFPLNEGSASLAQLNYDHVDIHFQLTNTGEVATARLMECGIRFFEDNTGSNGSHESRNSEEYEDSETDQFEDCGDSDIGSENDQFEECETVIWQ